MAIVQELNEGYFIERFREMGRGNQFTRAALEALYEYYDNYSSESGEDFKLDVIAICCEWYESTPLEVSNEYDIDLDKDLENNKENLNAACLSYLEENTAVIDLGDTFLYQAF